MGDEDRKSWPPDRFVPLEQTDGTFDLRTLASDECVSVVNNQRFKGWLIRKKQKGD